VIGLNGLVGDNTADFEVAQRAILILAHLPAEAHHVCGEDGYEFSSGGSFFHN